MYEVLQCHRQGFALSMYVNGNSANVSGLDRIFVMEDDVSREKGDITGTHMFQSALELRI